MVFLNNKRLLTGRQFTTKSQQNAFCDSCKALKYVFGWGSAPNSPPPRELTTFPRSHSQLDHSQLERETPAHFLSSPRRLPHLCAWAPRTPFPNPTLTPSRASWIRPWWTEASSPPVNIFPKSAPICPTGNKQ